MSKIATLSPDGLYALSEALSPYTDGLCFSRVAVQVRSEADNRGTWVMGVSAEATEDFSVQLHPAPLLQTPLVMEPGAVLAAIGYALS